MIFRGSDSELMIYLTLNQEFKVYILGFPRLQRLVEVVQRFVSLGMPWVANESVYVEFDQRNGAKSRLMAT